MTYVTESMRASLAEHRLRQICNANGVRVFRMAKPGTNNLSVDLIFAGDRIVVTGDITIGPHEKGVVSDLKYGLDFFAGKVGERHLCEKFLRKVWVPAAAVQGMRDAAMMIGESPILDEREESRRVVALERAIGAASRGDTTWDVTRSAEAFAKFWMATFDGDAEYPGHNYEPVQAGWLCAIQQRFAGLYREREARIEALVGAWEWAHNPEFESRHDLRCADATVALACTDGFWRLDPDNDCPREDITGRTTDLHAAKLAARAAVLRQAKEHPELWHCGEVDQ